MDSCDVTACGWRAAERTARARVEQLPPRSTAYAASSPAGATAYGICALGVNAFWGGVPLDGVGAPGCALWVDYTVAAFVVATGGVFTYPLVVPHDAALQGVSVFGQTFVLSPGANPLGLTSTDAVRLTVGS